MSDKPDFIDHFDGNTLLAALKTALAVPEGPGGGFAYQPDTYEEVCIATAFFSPAGFAALAAALEAAPKVRLLIGAEPPPEPLHPERKPGDKPRAAFERELVREGLEQVRQGMRRERDRMPFTPATAAHLRKLVELLRSGKMETRRYERAFLHAKAYILNGWNGGFIAGSSNLTRAGLERNLELNLGRWDPPGTARAMQWYERLWQDGVPIDLAELFEEAEGPFTPWQILLRVLWQLYGEELELEIEEEGGIIPLTAFQKHGVWRANRILKQYGGVIIADEVGLGKTFIAGAIMTAFAEQRQRVLLVCPAVLRDTTWKKFLSDFGTSRRVEVVSFDQLGREIQLADPRRPLADQRHLDYPVDDYQLVIVDEAHNYRNPDSPYRAAVLRRLMFARGRNLVLLTATPVNNSLWDLFHLMRFFLRQDSALADRGIISVQERFRTASRTDPANLNPDYLYPIIDAVTVKRTRAFVKRHYSGEMIKGPDGRMQPIVFPKPQAITVRYRLDDVLPGFFDKVSDALDPENGADLLAFARYAPGAYMLDPDPDDPQSAELAAGLLRSGLLKRFESSARAFYLSLTRMLTEHDAFLQALDQGKVINTAFLRELDATDELGFDELLEQSGEAQDAALFDVARLRADVEHDRHILADLAAEAGKITPENDPKLYALRDELRTIARQAAEEAVEADEARDKRKVLVFSFFADTVKWVHDALDGIVAAEPDLAPYAGRIAAVAGSRHAATEHFEDRNTAVWGFAPVSSRAPEGQNEDRFDLLISTDVLAEGMNLQQCRHIINYDLPWNPMRLVQRHGRIDRIGSPHTRVFLRTIFPADRLDDLLNLEQRILRKLTQAAKSIGVGTSPIHGADTGEQVFAETRAEIEKLADGDPTLFERGGTEAAAQTGEEYRQRLREMLEQDRDSIINLPGKAGSGMVKGQRSGIFFCAEVETVEGPRTFLRFVPASENWQPVATQERIVREMGTCLRIIDCFEDTPRYLPDQVADAAYSFWEAAQDDILAEWKLLTDPANLQPKVRPLNHRIAEFIRKHPPHGMEPKVLSTALDVLEAPWPRRDEMLLREEFRKDVGVPAHARAERLVHWILDTGLEPVITPAPLPEIEMANIRLVCWMAVTAESAAA